VLASSDVVIRALHLTGAAVWAGGLVFLGLAAATARRTIGPRERIAFFRSFGRRFALVGAVALALLIATGIDMASDRNAWGDLTSTSYGRTLLAKLILVALVIALTFVHSFVQGPRLSRLREQALERPDDEQLRAEIRARAARSGIVSALMLLATLAILVLAARLATLTLLVIAAPVATG
jgi:putative copper export protein